MAVILDILGSYIIRAAIVVIILNLMINLHQSLSRNTDRIYLNESINNAGNIIESDIKLAGYCYPYINHDTTKPSIANKRFPKVYEDQMSFYADTDTTGIQNLINYSVIAQPSSTTRKILLRKVNSSKPIEIARDITKFQIVYFRIDGTDRDYGDDKANVKSIYIVLEMESNITEKEYYSTSSGKYSTDNNNNTPLKVRWERLFFPENL